MDYTDTTSQLAREGEVTERTIRVYADLGLLDFKVMSNGIRIFRKGQGSRVKEIYAERIANRGRRAS